MKKILITLFATILLASCIERENTTAVEHTTQKGTYYININGCKYYKVKLKEHDVYQYIFSTYTGTGSDIIHLEDMCEKCKNK